MKKAKKTADQKLLRRSSSSGSLEQDWDRRLVFVMNEMESTYPDEDEEIASCPIDLLELQKEGVIKIIPLASLLEISSFDCTRNVGVQDCRKKYGKSLKAYGYEVLAMCMQESIIMFEHLLMTGGEIDSIKFSLGPKGKQLMDMLDSGASARAHENLCLNFFYHKSKAKEAIPEFSKKTFEVTDGKPCVFLSEESDDNEEDASASLAVVFSPEEESRIKSCLRKKQEEQEEEDNELEEPIEWTVHRAEVSFKAPVVDSDSDFLEGSYEIQLEENDLKDRHSLCQLLISDSSQREALLLALQKSNPRFLGMTDSDVLGGAQISLDEATERDMSEEEKSTSISIILRGLPLHKHDLVLKSPSEKLGQPDWAHPEQQKVAEELVRRACNALRLSQEQLGKKFDRLVFAILTPNFNSLQSQTAQRVRRADLHGGKVVKFSKTPLSEVTNFQESLRTAAEREKTLVLIIADECHHAPTAGGAHDMLLNELTGLNVLRLLVSATPQNCLTKDSRVLMENIVEWYEPTSLYRSMDYYVDTATWGVPLEVQTLRIKVQDGTVLEIDPHGKNGVQFRYPMHEYRAFCEFLNEQVKEKNIEGISFKVFKGVVTMKVLSSTEILDDAFQVDTGLLYWLGITKDATIKRNSKKESEHVRKGVPILCNTDKYETVPPDCRSRRTQRVLSDSVLSAIRIHFNKSFGSRLDGSRASLKNRVSTSTQLFDGHLILVDYLISLAFLATFRVEPAALDPIKRRNLSSVYRRLDEDVEVPPNETAPAILSLLKDETLIRRFSQALGVAKKLGFPEDASKCISKFRIGAGEKEIGSVQHIINFILEYHVREAEPEIKATKAGSDEDDIELPPVGYIDWDSENNSETTKWKRCLVYIIWQKLIRNRTDLTIRQSNSSESWFNETDRILHDLLDIHPKFGTGRMCVIRVYETDENLTIQDALRSGLVKLGLKEWLSVVADVGGGEGSGKVRDGFKSGSRKSTNLLSQLEKWTLQRDLRHPFEQEAQPDKTETLRKRVEKTYAEEFNEEEEIALAEGRKPRPKKRSAKYEDLENLPSIVILCEKGRMGDTFPHSFRFLDIRLRSSDNYSTFVQEFGRVCRYPALRSDTQGVHVIAIKDGNWTSQLEMVKSLMDEPEAFGNLGSFFAKGGSVVAVDPQNIIRFHADSNLELVKNFRSVLESERPVNVVGDWKLRRYLDILPTVLMSDERFDKQIKSAVVNKYTKTWGSQRIDQCLPGNIDSYVKRFRSRKGVRNKNLDWGAPVLKDGKVEVTNPYHGLEAYRSNYTVKNNKNASGEAKKGHYDSVKGGQDEDPRRLVLIAQCQQGKTGTYLHFIRLLKQTIETVPFYPLQILPSVRKGSWLYPYWADLVPTGKFKRLAIHYDRPAEGQYHLSVMKQRFMALILACQDLNTNWLLEYTNNYLLHSDGECIVSSAGSSKVEELLKLHKGKTAPVDCTLKKIVDESAAFDCINFDGRFQSNPAIKEAVKTLLNSDLISTILQSITIGDHTTDSIKKNLSSQVHHSRKFVHENLWGKAQMETKSKHETTRSSRMNISDDLKAEMETSSLTVSAKATTSSFAEVYCRGWKCFDVHYLNEKLTDMGTLSIPVEGFGALKTLKPFDVQPGGGLTLTSSSNKLRWVFVPSFNRAGVALLDYRSAFSEEGAASTVVCVVVRKGEQFDKYVEVYGSAYVVIGMPDSIKSPNFEEPVSVGRGIGYSRLFVQLMASHFGIEWVWMLDDNVEFCYRRRFEEDPGNEKKKQTPEPCQFNVVMESLERISRGEGDVKHLNAFPGAKIMGGPKRKGPRLRAETSPAVGKRRVETLEDLTGGSSNYGLIGIRRDPFGVRTPPSEPFMISYSVYSFLYLNVKDTVAKKVLFPPKSFWEDIEFNHLLDEAGFACLKCNLFYHRKKNLKLKSTCNNDAEEEEDMTIDEYLEDLFSDSNGADWLVPALKSVEDEDLFEEADLWANELFQHSKKGEKKGSKQSVVFLEKCTKKSRNESDDWFRMKWDKCIVVCRKSDEESFNMKCKDEDKSMNTLSKGDTLDLKAGKRSEKYEIEEVHEVLHGDDTLTVFLFSKQFESAEGKERTTDEKVLEYKSNIGVKREADDFVSTKRAGVEKSPIKSEKGARGIKIERTVSKGVETHSGDDFKKNFDKSKDRLKRKLDSEDFTSAEIRTKKSRELADSIANDEDSHHPSFETKHDKDKLEELLESELLKGKRKSDVEVENRATKKKASSTDKDRDKVASLVEEEMDKLVTAGLKGKELQEALFKSFVKTHGDKDYDEDMTRDYLRKEVANRRKRINYRASLSELDLLPTLEVEDKESDDPIPCSDSAAEGKCNSEGESEESLTFREKVCIVIDLEGDDMTESGLKGKNLQDKILSVVQQMYGEEEDLENAKDVIRKELINWRKRQGRMVAQIEDHLEELKESNLKREPLQEAVLKKVVESRGELHNEESVKRMIEKAVAVRFNSISPNITKKEASMMEDSPVESENNDGNAIQEKLGDMNLRTFLSDFVDDQFKEMAEQHKGKALQEALYKKFIVKYDLSNSPLAKRGEKCDEETVKEIIRKEVNNCRKRRNRVARRASGTEEKLSQDDVVLDMESEESDVRQSSEEDIDDDDEDDERNLTDVIETVLDRHGKEIIEIKKLQGVALVKEIFTILERENVNVEKHSDEIKHLLKPALKSLRARLKRGS